MKRIAVIACWLVAIAVFLWFFPLARVVPLAQFRAANQQASFNAADFAKRFWTERLLPSLVGAPDATTVLAALKENPHQAQVQFGRSVGMRRGRLILVKGSVTILSNDPEGIGLSMHSEPTSADVVLETDLLFGNTVRDASGLLSASDFPNSQDFNEISTELNRIVETTVI